MVNIGNLNTVITADASGYETSFERAEKSTRKFTKSQKQAEVQSKKVNKSRGNAARG